MKARNLLWICMVDIFLMLLISILAEYADLHGRFKNLENIVNTALETSVTASTVPEEFFSAKFQNNTSSYAIDSRGNNTYSTIKVLSGDGGAWVTGNTYLMAMYYTENAEFPTSQAVYNQFADNKRPETIYEWLFGKSGSDYCSPDYSWANLSKNTREMYGHAVSDRQVTNTRFIDYYNAVGKLMTLTTDLKVRDGDKLKVEQRSIPVLSQMGLEGLDPLNSDTSVTNDNLSSSYHPAKSTVGSSTKTAYYLTPYSLGVTYVPVEVLKPVLLSHLEQSIRFNKLKSTVTESAQNMSDYAAGTGCLSIDVYGVDGSTHSEHVSSDYEAKQSMLNDGGIEYDMSSLKIKVDYFYVDFYSDENYNIVNRIQGATSQYTIDGDRNVSSSNYLTNLPSRLKDRDTYSDKDGHRLVARVSVKLKIHIPYKSGVLQWFRHTYDTDGENHYDIRMWNAAANNVDFESDGVWYSYSTYTSTVR